MKKFFGYTLQNSLAPNGGYMYATTHPYTVTGDSKRKYTCLH